MKTSSAKAKGRALQNWVVKAIRAAFDLEEGDVESRSMGSAGVDVLLSPEARKYWPFSVECKSTRRNQVNAALEQSRVNAYEDTIPCVVYKPHGKPPSEALIYFKFSDFVEWRKEEKALELTRKMLES